MRFSLLTECYQGADFLPALYESLLAEHATGWRFEWILVDDCSNDGGRTVSLMERYAAIAPFPVKTVCLDKNHYGSLSVERGVKVAEGDYIILLNQDDFLSPSALDVFDRLIDQYEEVSDFAGVCGRCVDLDGNLIGTPFQWQHALSNELEIRHVHKIRGELFQCTKKELIAAYFRDLKPGYTNGHAWAKIARRYRYAYTNDVVRIYNTVNPDSMSNQKTIKNVEVLSESYLYYVKNNVDYLRKDWRSYFILLVHSLRFAMHSNRGLREVTSDMATDLRLATIVAYPVAAYLARQDCKRGRIAHAASGSQPR